MRLPLRSGLFVLVVALFVSGASLAQDLKDKAATEKQPTILFICEHGAAKSVIAAAYFDKLARERGLKYRAAFRGTNPDPTLAVAAVKGLKEDGIETNGWKPQLVTGGDLKAASMIVTLGCDLPGRDAVAGKVAEWNGIPSVSDNYQAARDEIVKRIHRLVDELAKK